MSLNIYIYIYFVITNGITWVTPSPLSITVPVKVQVDLSFLLKLAAKANIAWTAMYIPLTPNDSNMISAKYSLFSGWLSGGSVLLL